MAFTISVLALTYLTVSVWAQNLQDVLKGGEEKYRYPTSFTQGIVPVSGMFFFWG
jgi:hypothetical protein